MANKLMRVAAMGPLGGMGLAGGEVAMVRDINEWSAPGVKVEAKFFPWENWQQAADWLKPANIRGAMGYSNGGNTAAWMAVYKEYREATDLDLLVGLDPTVWLDLPALTPNIKRAHYFWNGNFIPWPTQFVGHGAYSLATGNRRTQLTYDTIYSFHGNVDKDPAIQKKTLGLFRALLASAS